MTTSNKKLVVLSSLFSLLALAAVPCGTLPRWAANRIARVQTS